MHENNVIHRDLKLGNLFLDRHLNMKVGDLGLATRLEDKDEKRKTICGTPNYIAPEIIQGDKSKRGHSFEVDIWSMGVILYTVLVGKPPYEAKDVKATYQRIINNEYSFPKHVTVSDYAKDLIGSMLQSVPSARYVYSTCHCVLCIVGLARILVSLSFCLYLCLTDHLWTRFVRIRFLRRRWFRLVYRRVLHTLLLYGRLMSTEKLSLPKLSLSESLRLLESQSLRGRPLVVNPLARMTRIVPSRQLLSSSRKKSLDAMPLTCRVWLRTRWQWLGQPLQVPPLRRHLGSKSLTSRVTLLPPLLLLASRGNPFVS
jgi:serine/threonine protein kinase